MLISQCCKAGYRVVELGCNCLVVDFLRRDGGWVETKRDFGILGLVGVKCLGGVVSC